MKIVILPMKALVLLAVLLGSPPASAQGTRAGYEREARFLTDDLGRSVQPADLRPRTDNFWYRKPGRHAEFELVDTAKNTAGLHSTRTNLPKNFEGDGQADSYGSAAVQFI